MDPVASRWSVVFVCSGGEGPVRRLIKQSFIGRSGRSFPRPRHVPHPCACSQSRHAGPMRCTRPPCDSSPWTTQVSTGWGGRPCLNIPHTHPPKATWLFFDPCWSVHCNRAQPNCREASQWAYQDCKQALRQSAQDVVPHTATVPAQPAVVWQISAHRRFSWGKPLGKELSYGIHLAESNFLCLCQNAYGNPDRAPMKTCSHPGLGLQGVPEPVTGNGWQ